MLRDSLGRLLHIRFKVSLLILAAIVLVKKRRERHQALETLVEQRTAELRGLACHLQTLRENEKSWLARELHDELGGLLIAAKLTLTRMRAKSCRDSELGAHVKLQPGASAVIKSG